MSDLELLNKIKQSPAAFSEIFTAYYKPIFGYILRRTGNFDNAADIAADTFVKAFTHIKNFDYRGVSIKVWLFRIATNEINIYFRTRKKHDSLFRKIAIADTYLFKTYLQHDREELQAELQHHEQFLTVLKALKKLPEKYQDVLALRYFEGKDNKEIAEILNLNQGTLKSLISRGLEKLREKCNH